jgi:acyl-CoA synthetase (AMP-forming)/AMP-acid ligase II
MPISFIHDEAMAVVDHYRVTRDDILLHLLPVHHATGLGMMFFPFLIGGASQEFRSTGGFDPAWTWERWKQGAPHPQKLFFSGVPTIYMRMMRYYQQSIAPRADAQDYIRGARAIRTCMCGTSALPAPIAEFWSGLLAKKILLRFGMTEVGAVIKMSLDDPNVPDGSIGKVAPGCDVILSDGDEGEILAKSPGTTTTDLPGLGLLNGALPEKRERKLRGGDAPVSDGGIRKKGRERERGAKGKVRSDKPKPAATAAVGGEGGQYPGWMTQKDREAADRRKAKYSTAS